MEIKQSAARQTWHKDGESSQASFDIAPRTGHYVGADWNSGPGRQAHLYVFAWHGVSDNTCDQRDESQWTYFVVKSSALPDQQTIALSRLGGRGTESTAGELRREVNRVANEIEVEATS